jgi:hypothetical protein
MAIMLMFLGATLNSHLPLLGGVPMVCQMRTSRRLESS